MGLGGAFVFVKHAPLSPWEGARGGVRGLGGLFVFYEACSPLPMGEGPGMRSGFGEGFCFCPGLFVGFGEGFWGNFKALNFERK